MRTKSLKETNPYLKNLLLREKGLWVSVASSSANEGSEVRLLLGDFAFFEPLGKFGKGQGAIGLEIGVEIGIFPALLP